MTKKKKNKPKQVKNNGLIKIANLTTKSISGAFSNYKKRKELEKIKITKLQKIEDKNQILRERKDLKNWEERLSKESAKIRLNEEDLRLREKEILSYFYKIEKKAIRDFILNQQTRIDGRKTDEIRPIWCEVDFLPTTHGSAVFTRGETQSLTTVTLGTSRDENKLDTVTTEGAERVLVVLDELSLEVLLLDELESSVAQDPIKNKIPAIKNNQKYKFRILIETFY